MPTIVIDRMKAPWRDRLRRYVIELDGEAVGRIGSAESVHLPVEDGEHHLRLTLSWASSPMRNVDVRGDDTAEFEARPGGTSWAAAYQMLFKRGSYIRLDRVR